MVDEDSRAYCFWIDWSILSKLCTKGKMDRCLWGPLGHACELRSSEVVVDCDDRVNNGGMIAEGWSTQAGPNSRS